MSVTGEVTELAPSESVPTHVTEHHHAEPTTSGDPDKLYVEITSDGEHGSVPIATGTFELNALDKLRIEPIGVPLVSEHPAGKIRHHPERLAAAITALGQGKLGAWRSRAEVGGL